MDHQHGRTGSLASPSSGDGGVRSMRTTFHCSDGVMLAGDVWSQPGASAIVIVNPATGVLARYYHRYARFLAERGFEVITYDYRGIGDSRPADLRRCGFRWSDWGTMDFAAVLEAADRTAAGRPVMVVGHSIGGFLPGLAAGFERCSALLSVGGQYAYWPDYALRERLTNVLKWHVVMPAVTAAMGYFPGRRLGWLEDLPAGVAFEWAFRRARVEYSFPHPERREIVQRLAAYRGPLLAATATDDPYGTPAAIHRALAYYSRAQKSFVQLSPGELGVPSIGHFDLFHTRHQAGFWRATAEWLASGGRQRSLSSIKITPTPLRDGAISERPETTTPDVRFRTCCGATPQVGACRLNHGQQITQLGGCRHAS